MLFFNLISVLERKISMRKPREELVKRGVLLEDPEQGESANELLLLLSVFCVADLLAKPHPCSHSFSGDKFQGSLLMWFLSVCPAPFNLLSCLTFAPGKERSLFSEEGVAKKVQCLSWTSSCLLPVGRGVLCVTSYPVPLVRVLLQPPCLVLLSSSVTLALAISGSF